MDIDSVECLSLPDASMDVDDVDSHHHHHSIPLHPVHLAASAGGGRPFPKANAGGGGAGAIVGAAGGPPATSVHELLECPVCTNSMFPPIHQVGALFLARSGSCLIPG
jgi:E3 ubiquitin-protein ligase SIAH2